MIINSIYKLCIYSLYTYLPLRVSQGFGEQGNIGKISKGAREHEPIFGVQENITVKFRRRKHFNIRNKYILFTGWEVRIGRNCARDLESASGGTQTEGTVSPHTDRPRPVNNIFIFFQLRFKSFWKIFLHSPTYVCFVCLLRRTRVRVNEARDRLQTKTKHYNMIFSSVSYIMALTALFEDKERFLCLTRQFII